MTTVIPVRFAYAVRDLWFNPGQTGAVEGDHLICSTERGTEIGLATADPFEVSDAELGHKTSGAALKSVVRVADELDLERADELARMGEDALPTFRRLVDEAGLDMKPVGVEYLFGRERVVCYFAADERVDFRGLVRNLSHELHERIDMRQIGVREEAAVVGGFGHCGQELCCARIGLSFEPVSIRMAKEQDLPLTSNKISGACGRLMCCLRYEFEAYRDFKGRAPKRNAVIDTPLGKAKVIEYDTPKEQLALRLENGKVVRIPLAEMVASDAAVKKSEELHCPCRPDTVLRESLDRLSSPDVQMALAELDRKMGVLKDDDFESDDIFVDTTPVKRRKRRTTTQEKAAEQTAAAPAEPTRRRRRRRSAKAAADTGDAQRNQAAQGQSPQEQPSQGRRAQTQTAQEGAPQEEKRSRRRRRRRSGSGAGAAANAAATPQETPAEAPKDTKEQQPSKPRRRRRHRSGANADNAGNGNAGNGGNGNAGNGGNGNAGNGNAGNGGNGNAGNGNGAREQQPQGKQDQAGAAKPRRRPGDHGGQAASEDAAPRRRRRRRGRGRGGNASDGAQASADQ